MTVQEIMEQVNLRHRGTTPYLTGAGGEAKGDLPGNWGGGGGASC